MQRNEVVLTCDVHRGAARAVETVTFALDGQQLECDLCEAHAAELRLTIGSWSSHARSVGAASGRDRGPTPRGARSRRAGGLRRAGSTGRARRVPVQPRARERLERMIVASEEVFADVGFDGASTNLIAERSGASVGTVYNFLGSKEAIAIALFDRYLAELRPHYDDAALVRAGVTGLVDLVAGFVDAHPAVAPLVRHRWGSAELRSARHRFQASLAVPVERLIARQRRFSDPIRRRAAAELCALLIWTMVVEAADRPRSEQGLQLGELKQVLAGYVGAACAAA